MLIFVAYHMSTCITGENNLASPKRRAALIGECMIELHGTLFGSMRQSFGGDSLNTALYLARLSRGTIDVHFVSAVGTDELSDGMVQRWNDAGVATGLVLRDPDRLPGLYMVHVDEHGERAFTYWRGESAARRLMQHQDFARIATELAAMDIIYLSGISLAILTPQDRVAMIDLLTALSRSGVQIALDSNYRPSLWPDRQSACAAMSAIASVSQLIITGFDDEQRLWHDASPEETVARLRANGAKTIVVKLGRAGSIYSVGSEIARVGAAPVSAVIDTTAAGDAFDAGFLAGWIMDRRPDECCRAGSLLAAAVIQHPGAIIPATAMPSLSMLYGAPAAKGLP